MELFESSSPWVAALGTLVVGLVVASVVAALVNLLARRLLGSQEEAGRVGGTTFGIGATVAFLVALGQLTGGQAADVGLTAATSRLLAGLPNLFVALVVGVLGWVLAVTVRATLRQVLSRFQPVAADLLAPLAFWAILVLAGLVAADQVGIEVRFLQWLIALILGGFVLAAAIALGLGSRALVSEVVAGRHVSRIVGLGDEVEVGRHRGTVIGLGHASVRLTGPGGGQVELPNGFFLAHAVVIVRRAGEV
ncbi:MAG TPA: mechanosensitive ion channel domain-containing protein [Nitriliruptorales bacterium]